MKIPARKIAVWITSAALTRYQLGMAMVEHTPEHGMRVWLHLHDGGVATLHDL